MMRIREVEDLQKLDLIDESRFVCFNTIFHSLTFNFSQILTKFSKNKGIIRQYQRESDVEDEEVSETD